MVEVRRVSNQQQAAKRAAQALHQFFQNYTHAPLLFLSSGGSALKILEYLDPSLLGIQTTLGVLDERYSTDPKVVNFTQLSQTAFFNACSLQIKLRLVRSQYESFYWR